MLKSIRIVLLTIVLSLFAVSAFAHGGGLDAYGGHHNRKQGGYHFHRGALPGQSFSSKEEALTALGAATKKTSSTSPTESQNKPATNSGGK